MNEACAEGVWMMNKLIMVLCLFIVSGCATTPQGVHVVSGFELERYLGTWYEIARLDHHFERGLSRVSATYSMRSDGGINVVNRGYNIEHKAWKEVNGRAYPAGDPGEAKLKVTFFWPFYAGYNVIDLDVADYGYALVCGPSTNYLWILARDRQLEQAVLDRLVSKARGYGFDTDELIFVDHGE